MKRTLFLTVMLAVVSSMPAQQPKWLDPNVNEENRMESVADYYAYESRQTALKGD